MDQNAERGNEAAKPESVHSLISFEERVARRSDMVVPPPVPTKDTPPLRRAMTSSTRRLSFGPMSSGQQRTIKFGRGRFSTTELIPQPSDDPDDPLVC